MLIENKKKLFLVFLLVGSIILFFVSFAFLSRKPTVQRIVPADTSKNMSIFTEMIITFKNELNEKEKEKISFTLTPQTATTTIWQNGKNLVVKPSPYLAINTTYTLSLYYKKNLIRTMSFTTIPLTDISDDDQQELQNSDDYEYARSLQEMLEERPWLGFLPIETERYIAVYDYELEKLRINIIQIVQDADLANLKKEIQKEIEILGIPKTLPIDWVIGEE